MDFASDTAMFSNPELAAFTDPANRRWYSGPPFVASRIPEWERILRGSRADVRRLHDAGVALGAGTDVVAPVWALHTELEELVASGLTPAERSPRRRLWAKDDRQRRQLHAQVRRQYWTLRSLRRLPALTTASYPAGS